MGFGYRFSLDGIGISGSSRANWLNGASVSSKSGSVAVERQRRGRYRRRRSVGAPRTLRPRPDCSRDRDRSDCRRSPRLRHQVRPGGLFAEPRPVRADVLQPVETVAEPERAGCTGSARPADRCTCSAACRIRPTYRGSGTTDRDRSDRTGGRRAQFTVIRHQQSESDGLRGEITGRVLG